MDDGHLAADLRLGQNLRNHVESAGEGKDIGRKHRNPELDGVPFVLDLALTGEQRQALEFLYAGQGIGRPFVAPPDLPPDRLKMLRDAFKATMTDPAFVAEAQKSKLDLEPEDGEHLAVLIAKIYATPKPIVDKITGMIK